ncbi:MAG: TRAP transporter small permease subunit [Loktanella sp.]|nr:TRAP transporter small permease subunit [Loktanella sp.]
MYLVRLLRQVSEGLIRIERIALIFLVASVAVFVLMNVGFRLFNVTIASADELAILSMTLAGFVGASLMLRARTDPAVQIVYEIASEPIVRGLRMLVSTLAAAFGLILLWLNWRWFNLPELIAAGFDVSTFEMSTFNFLYTETTPVLGLPYFWFFLVMPWFALTLSIHALANLAEDLRLIEPRHLAQEFSQTGD